MNYLSRARASTLQYYLFVNIFIEYYVAQVANLRLCNKMRRSERGEGRRKKQREV